MGKGFVNTTYFHVNKTTPSGSLLDIGNDVWIGSHVGILEGVTIGDGAIIGAGSIVTKDIPAYSIAVGVPAKVIKYRFSNDQIASLLKIKWWEWDIEEIRYHISKFRDIESFKFE